MSKKKKQKYESFVELPNGGKLHLLPISQSTIENISKDVKRSFEKEGRQVDTPTYTTSAGETIAWNKESVEKDGTDEDKQSWEEYEKTESDLTLAQEQATSEYVFLYGTRSYELPTGGVVDLIVDEITGEWTPPAGWLSMKRRSGYVLPDDGYQAKMDYLNHLISSVSIIRDIITRCLMLSMKNAVPEEFLLEAEDKFRSAMVRAAEERFTGARSESERSDGSSAEEIGERSNLDTLTKTE
jgi:hypothetical protein